MLPFQWVRILWRVAFIRMWGMSLPMSQIWCNVRAFWADSLLQAIIVFKTTTLASCLFCLICLTSTMIHHHLRGKNIWCLYAKTHQFEDQDGKQSDDIHKGHQGEEKIQFVAWDVKLQEIICTKQNLRTKKTTTIIKKIERKCSLKLNIFQRWNWFDMIILDM